MRKPILFLLLCVCSHSATRAQDTHFSQYNTTPLTINPALTGVFNGIMRFSNNYRSQWTGIGEGYKSIYSSLDFAIGKQKSKDHYWGAGLMVNTDKAGINQFYTTYIMPSLAFTTALNDYSTHFISMGLQVGLFQRGIDLTKVTWDNQWSGGAFDPFASTGENIQLDAFTFVDMSAGLLWYFLPNEFNMTYAGISFMHFNTPNTSFYVEQIDEMPMRITAHGGADIPLNQNENATWISPKILFMMQGEHSELTIGGYVKNRLILKSKYTNYRKQVEFTWGASYRFNDAAILSARVDYGRFGLGVSYDINMSSLSDNASGTSSMEFSLSYITPIRRGDVGVVTNRMPRFF